MQRQRSDKRNGAPTSSSASGAPSSAVMPMGTPSTNTQVELTDTALKLSKVIEREARRRSALRNSSPFFRLGTKSRIPSLKRFSRGRSSVKSSRSDRSMQSGGSIPRSGTVMPMDAIIPEEKERSSADHPDASGPPVESTRRASRLASSSQAETEPYELSWMERVWIFFDDPQSSKGAYYFSLALFFFIALSTGVFVAQTEPSLLVYARYMEMIEATCAIVFSFEFSCRFLSSPSKCGFLRDYSNWIDLAAILPYYIEVLLAVENAGSFGAIRVIRLTRVARVLKMSRYSSAIQVFVQAIAVSMKALSMLMFLMGIAVIVLSSAIYFAEYTPDGCREDAWSAGCHGNPDKYQHDPACSCTDFNPYRSIASSFWWCIVTMSTVGYGDNVPVTTAGKLVGSVTILTGMLVLALPITVIGTNFQKVMKSVVHQTMNSNVEYLKGKRQICRDEIQAILDRFHAVTEDIRLDIDDIINVYDTDNSGMLEDEELARFRHDLEILQNQALSNSRFDPSMPILQTREQSDELNPTKGTGHDRFSSQQAMSMYTSKSCKSLNILANDTLQHKRLAHQSTVPTIHLSTPASSRGGSPMSRSTITEFSRKTTGPMIPILSDTEMDFEALMEDSSLNSESPTLSRPDSPETVFSRSSSASSNRTSRHCDRQSSVRASSAQDEDELYMRLMDMQRNWEERLLATEQRLESKLNNITKILIRVEELLERDD